MITHKTELNPKSRKNSPDPDWENRVSKPAKLSFDAAQRAVSAKLRLGQAATALRVVLLLLKSGAFSYARRTPALTRLNYTVWTSTDLVNWAQDAGAIQTSGIAVKQVETVAVVVSPGLLTNAKLFVRLRAAPCVLAREISK